MTPAAIAELFKASVRCSDTTQISSYSQIQEGGSDFAALTDRERFRSLLEENLGGDVLLCDIFMHMFDEGVGIHTFADERRRCSPRAVISEFLNTDKCAYLQAYPTKVYVAFNAWLAFFGLEQVSEQWKHCPFCGHKVHADVCGNPDCKKKTSDFEKALRELKSMLDREKSGTATINPRYWSKIRRDSELDLCFKREILKLRGIRTEMARAEKERKRKEEKKSDEAQEALGVHSAGQEPECRGAAESEASIEEPQNDPSVSPAVKAGDETVTRRLDASKSRGKPLRSAVNDVDNGSRIREECREKMHSLAIVIRRIEASLSGGAGAVTFKAYINEADRYRDDLESYAERGTDLSAGGEETPLDQYNRRVRDAIVKCIEDLEEAASDNSARRHRQSAENVSIETRFEDVFNAYSSQVFRATLGSTAEEGAEDSLAEAREALIKLCMSRTGDREDELSEDARKALCDAIRLEALRRIAE